MDSPLGERKSEAVGDDIVKLVQILVAKGTIKDVERLVLEHAIDLWGTSPLKVVYVILMTGRPVSPQELNRHLGMNIRTVYYAIGKAAVEGLIHESLEKPGYWEI